MGRYVKYLAFIVAVTFAGGCYDSFEGGGSLDSGDIPAPNVTIEQLREMLESESLLIYDDMIVRGMVTSTDRYGNFYKTFVMESDGYALEVMEGLTDSYVRHDVGSVVVVKLRGLMLANYREVLQVGLESAEGSYYTLDYLEVEQIIDERIFNSYEINEVEPYEVSIDELTTAMCGRLVKVKSLLHTPAEDDTQPYTWISYQQFVDNSDNTLYCYTSDYATFALLEIPQQSVSLVGILRYGSISGVSGGEQYIIEMRGVYDCESEE